MIGCDEYQVELLHHVLIPTHRTCPRPMSMFACRFYYRHIRIIVSDMCTALLQHLHERITWRLTLVINIGLIRQPDNEDPTAFDGLAAIIQGIANLMNDVLWHARINFACEFDK